jgi:hypothetical protein
LEIHERKERAMSCVLKGMHRRQMNPLTKVRLSSSSISLSSSLKEGGLTVGCA